MDVQQLKALSAAFNAAVLEKVESSVALPFDFAEFDEELQEMQEIFPETDLSSKTSLFEQMMKLQLFFEVEDDAEAFLLCALATPPVHDPVVLAELFARLAIQTNKEMEFTNLAVQVARSLNMHPDDAGEIFAQYTNEKRAEFDNDPDAPGAPHLARLYGF